MNKIKVIIAGSRSFKDYKFLKLKLDSLLSEYSEVEIVSGECRGADKLGEQYGRTNSWTIKPFPAKWGDLTATPCKIKTKNTGQHYNCLAGFNRNEQMAEYSDVLIAFRKNNSNGTSDMIARAKKHNLKIHIFDV